MKRYIAFLLIRLLSLYLLLSSFSFLPATCSMVSPYDSSSVLLSFITKMPNVLMLVFSVILWILANPLSAWISKGFEESPFTETLLNRYSLECVIISAIGLFMVVETIPGFLGTITYYVLREDFHNVLTQKDYFSNLGYKVIFNLASIIVGTILVIFPKRISLSFRNLRVIFKDEKTI